MLRATLHLILLGCYLGAMIGAQITETPPTIRCYEGFQGVHGFIGRDAAKKECLVALDLMKNNLVRLQKGLLRDLRNRETGKPLRIHNELSKFGFLQPDAAFTFSQSPSCAFYVQRTVITKDRKLIKSSSTRSDMTPYFYYWDRVLNVVKQILEQCYQDEHWMGERGPRNIGHGTADIGGDGWFFKYYVSVHYLGERDDRSADREHGLSYVIGHQQLSDLFNNGLDFTHSRDSNPD
jgi:hypothetical protein